MTDDGASQLLINVVMDLSDIDLLAKSGPAGTAVPLPFSVAQVETFADGQVGAQVYFAASGTSQARAWYVTFVRDSGGQWLINSIDLPAT